MSNEFATDSVPVDKRVSFFGLALVHAGMLTAMDQFMLGAVLGDSMSLSDAFIAITIASLIFGLVTFGVGYIGMKHGMSGTLIAKYYGFGRIGTVIVGLLIAISLIGWFGVQNAVFAKGLTYFIGNSIDGKFVALASGLAITVLVSYGFNALKITAKIAVPFFIIVIVFISFSLINSNYQPPINIEHTRTNISQAITMIIGGCILATIMTPDITRFSKDTSSVFYIVIITIIAGEYIINGVAIMLSHYLKNSDVVDIMTISTGEFGVIAIILSTLRVNDLNLYSSSLGISNALKIFSIDIKINKLVLIVGFAGTILSIAGILDKFTIFLNVLGYIFPPIISVIMVNYFLLEKEINIKIISYSAIISCIIGALVGVYDYGIPVINAMIITALVYLSSEYKRFRYL